MHEVVSSSLSISTKKTAYRVGTPFFCVVIREREIACSCEFARGARNSFLHFSTLLASDEALAKPKPLYLCFVMEKAYRVGLAVFLRSDTRATNVPLDPVLIVLRKSCFSRIVIVSVGEAEVRKSCFNSTLPSLWNEGVAEIIESKKEILSFRFIPL